MTRRKRWSPGAERKIYIRQRWGRWWWYCNLCYPMQQGSTMTFEQTAKNVERHCEHVRAHHEWVSQHGPTA